MDSREKIVPVLEVKVTNYLERYGIEVKTGGEQATCSLTKKWTNSRTRDTEQRKTNWTSPSATFCSARCIDELRMTSSNTFAQWHRDDLKHWSPRHSVVKEVGHPLCQVVSRWNVSYTSSMIHLRNRPPLSLPHTVDARFTTDGIHQRSNPDVPHRGAARHHRRWFDWTCNRNLVTTPSRWRTQKTKGTSTSRPSQTRAFVSN